MPWSDAPRRYDGCERQRGLKQQRGLDPRTREKEKKRGVESSQSPSREVPTACVKNRCGWGVWSVQSMEYGVLRIVVVTVSTE